MVFSFRLWKTYQAEREWLLLKQIGNPVASTNNSQNKSQNGRSIFCLSGGWSRGIEFVLWHIEQYLHLLLHFKDTEPIECYTFDLNPNVISTHSAQSSGKLRIHISIYLLFIFIQAMVNNFKYQKLCLKSILCVTISRIFYTNRKTIAILHPTKQWMCKLA